MVDGGRFFVQLVRSALGFMLGVSVCGLFLAWGLFIGPAGQADAGAVAGVLGFGLFSASLLGGLVFLPALALIALAEMASLRSFFYHVGVGGLLAFFLWTVGSHSGEAVSVGTGLRPGTSVALAAGFLGGFVYWTIAGRLSGCWKRPGNSRP